jgi:serine/threonine-protein kinase HipA
MERVAGVVRDFCTFPAVENVELARRVLFNFLTGNEDMHLKNFSLMTLDGKVRLAPAYDLLNTTLVLGTSVREEVALPIRGKKSNLTRNDLVRYFIIERLGLGPKVAAKLFDDMMQAADLWPETIRRSFLSTGKQDTYLKLLAERIARLQS